MKETMDSILDQKYPFVTTAMPIQFNECTPNTSEATLKNHYEYLNKYVNGLNKLMEENEGYKSWSIKKILTNYSQIPIDLEDDFIENAGGIFNHEALFGVLCKPNMKEIKGKLADDLVRKYGSIENFKTEIKQAAMDIIGVGYACLVLDENGELTIITVENQENPIMYGMKPIFMIDLWEHAYYLDVQVNKAKYLDDQFNIIDWDKIEQLYNDYLKEM